MVLDKIEAYKKLAESMDERGRAIVNYTLPVDKEIIRKYIRQGKWSVLIFMAHENEISTHGLRVIPDLPSHQWPYGYTMPYMEWATTYPNMLTRIQWSHIVHLKNNRESCEKYLNDWEVYYKNILPVYELFGGKDDLKELKDIVFNKDSWPSKELTNQEKQDRTKDVLLKMEGSRSQKLLFELIDKLNEDETYLPHLPEGDLGIYSDWISSLLSSRGYYITAESEDISNKIQNLLIQAVKYAHGFDTQGNSPSYISSCARTEYVVFDPLKSLINIEEFDLGKIQDEIKAIPEFQVAKAMNEQKKGYNGIAHMEAAAILDEQYNEPLRAWKCLVSSGYWVGKNMPEAQATVLKAAISLCERQNWQEAAKVLKYNLDILESA